MYLSVYLVPGASPRTVPGRPSGTLHVQSAGSLGTDRNVSHTLKACLCLSPRKVCTTNALIMVLWASAPGIYISICLVAVCMSYGSGIRHVIRWRIVHFSDLEKTCSVTL